MHFSFFGLAWRYMLRFLISVFLFFFVSSVFALNNYEQYGPLPWPGIAGDPYLTQRLGECNAQVGTGTFVIGCVYGPTISGGGGSVDRTYIFSVLDGHCPAGSILDNSTQSDPPRCMCSAGYLTVTNSGSQVCACTDGFAPESGSCDRPTPTCSSGIYTDGSGVTTCNPSCLVGEQLNSSTHTCEPITCPDGYSLVGNVCVLTSCPAGQVLSGNACIPAGCPAGQVLSNGVCIDSGSVCSAGSHLFGGQCVPDSATGGSGGSSCPVGSHLLNGLCVSDSSGAGNGSGSSSAGTNPNTIPPNSGTAKASSDCSVPPVCSSTDQTQCAILDQQWRTMCANAFFNPSMVPQSLLSDKASSLYRDSSNDPALDFSTRMGEVLNQSSLGASCPQDQSISLRYGVFSVSYQPLCDLASRMSGFVVLIFSLIAARVVWQAFQ